MKWLSILCMLATVGCTSTTIETESWTLTRISLLQDVALPTIVITPDGQWHMTGYKNSGGAKEVEKIIRSAVEEAMKVAP
jgi:hypothetical protein